MPKLLTAYGHVTNGKLFITERTQFDHALGDWRDGAVVLTVGYLYPRRSNNQSRYYWGVCVPLIRQAMEEAMGEFISLEEVHDWLKRQFNPREIATTNGHVITLAGETKRLDTAAFAAYVERVRQFAADTLSIDIPDPVKLEGANQPLQV